HGDHLVDDTQITADGSGDDLENFGAVKHHDTSHHDEKEGRQAHRERHSHQRHRQPHNQGQNHNHHHGHLKHDEGAAHADREDIEHFGNQVAETSAVIASVSRTRHADDDKKTTDGDVRDRRMEQLEADTTTGANEAQPKLHNDVDSNETDVAFSADKVLDYQTALLSTTLFFSTSERPTTFIVDDNHEMEKAQDTSTVSTSAENVDHENDVLFTTMNPYPPDKRIARPASTHNQGQPSDELNLLKDVTDEHNVTSGDGKVTDWLTHVEDSDLLETRHIQEHIIDSHAEDVRDEEEGRTDHSGESEDTDVENRLEMEKRTEVALPDDVQARSDLGSGQEDNNVEDSFSEVFNNGGNKDHDLQESRTVIGNRVDTVGLPEDEIARNDDEVRKLLETDAETSNAIKQRVSK
ncbi:hypothetical protein BIW11_05914, partial [Tropilaelaps mercedesae]